MTNDYKDRARSALLFEYLQHSTAEDIPAPRDQLCQYLDCDRKTLAKEIRALQACGFDIRVKKAGKQNAFYYGGNDVSLAELQIWIDEAHAGSYLAADDEEKLSETMVKLGGARKAELVQKSTMIFNTRKHSDAPVLRTIEVLQQAILNHRQTSFLYFDWDENHERVYRRAGERYLVQPIGLVNKDDNYYLLSWHETGKNITAFRIDRIDAAIMSEEGISEAAVEARANVAEFTRQAFRMYGGETEQVTLQFTHAAINYVFDKFGRDIRIRPAGKDLYEAELEVQISPPFWGWIFQFADIMQITAPENVLTQYEARIAAVRKKNRRLRNQLAGIRKAAAAAEAAEPSEAEEITEPSEAAEPSEVAEITEAAEAAEPSEAAEITELPEPAEPAEQAAAAEEAACASDEAPAAEGTAADAAEVQEPAQS